MAVVAVSIRDNHPTAGHWMLGAAGVGIVYGLICLVQAWLRPWVPDHSDKVLFSNFAAAVLAVYGGRGSSEADIAFWGSLIAAWAFLNLVYAQSESVESPGWAGLVGVLLAGASRCAVGRSGLNPGAAALSPALLAAPAMIAMLVSRGIEARAARSASRVRTLDELRPFFGDKRSEVLGAATRRFSEFVGEAPGEEAVRYVASLARSRSVPPSVIVSLVAEGFVVGKETSTPVLLELFEHVGEQSPFAAADREIQNALLARADLDVEKLATAIQARVDRNRFEHDLDRAVLRVRAWNDERGRSLARAAFLGGALTAGAASSLGDEWGAELASEAIARGTKGGNHARTIELIGRLPARRGAPLLARAIETWDVNDTAWLLEKLFREEAPLIQTIVGTSEEDRAALLRSIDARLAGPLERDYHRRVYTQLRARISPARSPGEGLL
jgi:hypothetical protein